ncbi:hypothetical protein LX73_0234 [Fodinibius salinus]|uniref:Uncharacterized protein n=1 Tax=Fodinibius salinus TaxID=860790 RepID=A0A5D3YM18_9BACT|nr:hypothetical protein [Fodinibius salinus]TYP94940.1 hypothetical protein LX73_0234 [Fodinibius salinus]
MSFSVLSDTHQIWKKQEQIKAYLDNPNEEFNLNRTLQPDTCHIHPDYRDRCL